MATTQKKGPKVWKLKPFILDFDEQDRQAQSNENAANNAEHPNSSGQSGSQPSRVGGIRRTHDEKEDIARRVAAEVESIEKNLAQQSIELKNTLDQRGVFSSSVNQYRALTLNNVQQYKKLRMSVVKESVMRHIEEEEEFLRKIRQLPGSLVKSELAIFVDEMYHLHKYRKQGADLSNHPDHGASRSPDHGQPSQNIPLPHVAEESGKLKFLKKFDLLGALKTAMMGPQQTLQRLSRLSAADTELLLRADEVCHQPELVRFTEKLLQAHINVTRGGMGFIPPGSSLSRAPSLERRRSNSNALPHGHTSFRRSSSFSNLSPPATPPDPSLSHSHSHPALHLRLSSSSSYSTPSSRRPSLNEKDLIHARPRSSKPRRPSIRLSRNDSFNSLKSGSKSRAMSLTDEEDMEETESRGKESGSDVEERGGGGEEESKDGSGSDTESTTSRSTHRSSTTRRESHVDKLRKRREKDKEKARERFKADLSEMDPDLNNTRSSMVIGHAHEHEEKKKKTVIEQKTLSTEKIKRLLHTLNQSSQQQNNQTASQLPPKRPASPPPPEIPIGLAIVDANSTRREQVIDMCKRSCGFVFVVGIEPLNFFNQIQAWIDQIHVVLVELDASTDNLLFQMKSFSHTKHLPVVVLFSEQHHQKELMRVIHRGLDTLLPRMLLEAPFRDQFIEYIEEIRARPRKPPAQPDPSISASSPSWMPSILSLLYENPLDTSSDLSLLSLIVTSSATAAPSTSRGNNPDDPQSQSHEGKHLQNRSIAVRLEQLWDVLALSPTQRLDMLIRYSTPQLAPRFLDAVALWEEIAYLVILREYLLARARHAASNVSMLTSAAPPLLRGQPAVAKSRLASSHSDSGSHGSHILLESRQMKAWSAALKNPPQCPLGLQADVRGRFLRRGLLATVDRNEVHRLTSLIEQLIHQLKHEFGDTFIYLGEDYMLRILN